MQSYTWTTPGKAGAQSILTRPHTELAKECKKHCTLTVYTNR